MVKEKEFPELKYMIEKALFHRDKAEEYKDHIVELLIDMGYINEELIGKIVNELVLNINSPKSPEEYVDDIFENLNVEGNF